MNPNYFEIVNGPSKEELFNACMHYADDNADTANIFDILVSPDTKATHKSLAVDSITHEDGSGESFVLRGDCSIDNSFHRFKGYYRTDTRKGFLNILN